MSSPAATMADYVAPDQFLRLLADSGLVPGEEVKTLTARLSPRQRQDTRQIAQELVKLDKLTRYQAAMLCQGRTKGLLLAEGKYIILDKIGQGGMGMVFRAKSRQLDRVVALKVLPPSMVLKGNALQRFQREVEAAARLNHPNIVATFDAGEDKGVHFMVMEFVDGRDLSKLVKGQGPVTPIQAAACMIHTARGLAHAHQSGIIHRDIKPGNLLLTKAPGAQGGGLVKILDMGLARFEEGNNAPGSANELTQTGTVVGTCDYMSPEQAMNSRNADQRSDIYSVGCTLFYLATGKVMFAGETAMEKLLAHREQPIPSLRALRSDVPKKLDAVYQRMVAKKADDRFPTMSAALAELEACVPADEAARALADLANNIGAGAALIADGIDSAGTGGSHTVPEAASQPSTARRRWPLVAAGAAVLAVFGLGSVLILTAFSSPASNPSVAAATTSKTTEAETTADSSNSTNKNVPDQGKMAKGKRYVNTFTDKMKELNPGFQLINYHFDKSTGSLSEVAFETDHVTDISPVRQLTSLQDLRCTGSGPGKGRLADLSPLQSLPLRNLNCAWNPINDLTPLKGMPLQRLDLHGTQVVSLTPLEGAPIETLDLNNTHVRDLSPLRKLTSLKTLRIRAVETDDLSPLRDLPLVQLELDMRPSPGRFAVLRSIKTLKFINNQPVEELFRKFPPKN